MKRIIAVMLAAILSSACFVGHFTQSTVEGADSSLSVDSVSDTSAVEEEPLISGEDYVGLLPLGSVVLLKNSDHKLMVMGYLQSLSGDESGKIYTYSGCLFPEGYQSADEVYLFDQDQIDGIYFIGYRDSEQMEFMRQVEEYLASL